MRKETVSIKTHNRTDFIAITEPVQSVITSWGVTDGLCYLYVPHTTAGIFINEGYDPDVMLDVEKSLDKLVPWNNGYAHYEGNSAAHIKSILVGGSQQVLIDNGRLMLGQWQKIFFAEFDGPRSRQLIISCLESR